jgi:hypothetical protein
MAAMKHIVTKEFNCFNKIRSTQIVTFELPRKVFNPGRKIAKLSKTRSSTAKEGGWWGGILPLSRFGKIRADSCENKYN